MTDSASVDRDAHQPARPGMTGGQKMFLRLSGVLAMALFLLPTVYVVKYYALDRPQEERLVQRERSEMRAGRLILPSQITATDFPLLEEIATHDSTASWRIMAVRLLGKHLRDTALSFKRPMESVAAKSTLADIAEHDTDPTVRAAAQDEIGKIAEGGAVIRR